MEFLPRRRTLQAQALYFWALLKQATLKAYQGLREKLLAV